MQSLSACLQSRKNEYATAPGIEWYIRLEADDVEAADYAFGSNPPYEF